MAVLAACIMSAGILCIPSTVYAKKITSFHQLESLAEKEVKGAHIIEVDKDYEKGIIVYEARLLKGKKEYELAYRASDGKLISQSWELRKAYVKKGSGKLIGLKKCKSLAKKQVSNGKIVKAVKKRSKGIDLYDIKMQKSNKKYELKYHARTGKLLEYEWKQLSPSSSQSVYIGESKARNIALKKAPGASITKFEFDRDDGTAVYEIELRKGIYEYEVKINAVTGAVIEFEKDIED